MAEHKMRDLQGKEYDFSRMSDTAKLIVQRQAKGEHKPRPIDVRFTDNRAKGDR